LKSGFGRIRTQESLVVIAKTTEIVIAIIVTNIQR